MNQLLNIEWVPNKEIDTNLVNKLLEDCLLKKQFTNYGKNVKSLEKFLTEKLEIDDNKTVVVVLNGSVALHILTSAIDYYHKRVSQWATQSFTFPASAQGTLSNVIIVDIDLDGGIDLSSINEGIDGLIITNIFGNVVDINKYVDFCEKNNKFLIFDNAATAYTFYKGKNCLNYGHGSTISLHHTKPFGFGEGGAIIVDKKYEDIVRGLITFGMNLGKKHYVPEGNNSKMSEISAIYILQYIENNFESIINIHQRLYHYLKNLLETKYKNLDCHLFPSFHDNVITPACFPLLFNKYNDNIRLKLLEKGVLCRKYYHPLENTPTAINIYDKILCIPCTKDMDESQIIYILEIIEQNI
jgi:dTDP-4-amino-4,6-dideoxygalactose transaminase